jgi:hypothetical protein
MRAHKINKFLYQLGFYLPFIPILGIIFLIFFFVAYFKTMNSLSKTRMNHLVNGVTDCFDSVGEKIFGGIQIISLYILIVLMIS